MYFELWNVESGNIINSYDTQERALEVVRGLLEANSPAYAEALALSCHDESGDVCVVAEGTALAALAQKAGKSPAA
jgi:hypothetical protein